MVNRKEEEYIAGYSYDEWRKIERQFQDDYDNSTKYNKSFNELINEILQDETLMSFMSKTGLGQSMFYRLKNQVNENDPPYMYTLISFCVGYNLDLMMAQALLHSLGLDFNRHNKRDYAYSFLLTRCRGKSIDECNDILEKLGIPQKYWLGEHKKKEK